MNEANAVLNGHLVERETEGLIGSDKVEGTWVHRPDGEHIGHIARLMIGKRDGRVAYAILGFGGFLGLGRNYYPLPWTSLVFDAKLGGYVVDVTEEQLRGAPYHGELDLWDWEDSANGARVNEYWSKLGTTPK